MYILLMSKNIADKIFSVGKADKVEQCNKKIKIVFKIYTEIYYWERYTMK